ncbi:MAG TPA: hypothetical protein ENI15_14985 [Spirochaetes bacterium]|nr:hypothetical protein [Spirochaetota bacterium]
MPGMVTITASVREAPPAWAVLERHLMKTMEVSAQLFLDKFTYHGGTLREHGKIDDDYECFISWPLLYAIGGDEKFLDWGLREFNAITRQWTYQHRQSVYREFIRHYDALHLSEGYVGFQYFGLADPTIPENIDRSRRFAGFYLNEDPEVQNYDPEYRIIRSIATGSKGPSDHQGAGLAHASIYPIMKNIDPDWHNKPELRAEIQKIYDEVVVPCDIPANLAITGLVTHAYLLTGDEKYKKWVLEYVDAWMERIRENNGIIPDNIGRTGKIGEYRNGQWWGGLFGWNTRYGIEIMFKALITASECAHLISGDPKYLDLLRSQVDVLLNLAKKEHGNLVVPYRYGPEGWYDYRPFMPHILSHLWHASLDEKDWERIVRVRKGSKYGPRPYAYATSPAPGTPEEETWRPDGSIMDWNYVEDDIKQWNENRLNEKPHLQYLAGENPDWPENIMQAEFKMLCRNIERIKDPNYKHIWGSQTMIEQRAVFTNGLQQITMGAPHTSFNGGLLRAHVRYFDIDRARPGLPLDTSALVEKIEADRTVIHLVNLNVFETRNLIVQAGSYGEHEFTEVHFIEQSKDSEGKMVLSDKTVPVNKKYFAVELPPATTIKLEIGMKRFVNKPTYAFPWH